MGIHALVGWRFLCVCAFDGFLLWVRIASACSTIASLCNTLPKGTHAQYTPAHQRRPITPHEPQTAIPQTYSRTGRCIASNQHSTLTSHRTLCHRGTSQRHKSAAPTTGTTGSHTVHIQLKPRRRGNRPGPVMKPRHASAGALGRNKQGRRKLRRSRSRTQPHTDVHIHMNRPGRPRRGGPLDRRTRLGGRLIVFVVLYSCAGCNDFPGGFAVRRCSTQALQAGATPPW